LGVLARKDGGSQVAYNGIPLYYWFKDSQPGDVTGQGVGDVWFVVHPDIASMTVISPVVQLTKDPKLGDILTNQGMTLYRLEKDQANASSCYGQCATTWPPLLVAGGEPQAGKGVTGTLGVITRTDGGKQVTYNGVPLYFFAKDMRPGDINGEDVGGVWYAVTVAGESAEPPASAAPTETTTAMPTEASPSTPAMTPAAASSSSGW
jgi:predicted lipoprotein with Yx(FWY)xxD motif